MASQRQVDKVVLRVIRQKDGIGGQNPVSYVCDKTGNNGVAGQAMVRKAFENLANRGHVTIDTDSIGRITKVTPVVPVVRNRAHIDRTEFSAQTKREHTFAKGVPSYLRDDQCSKVEVRQTRQQPEPDSVQEEAQPVLIIDDAHTNEPQKEGTPVHGCEEARPYHIVLTECLKALRAEADETGAGYEKSIRTILMEHCQLSDSQATRAMDHLRGLGLYETTMTGLRTSSYTVDLDTSEVTAEKVTEYRRSLSKSKKRPVIRQESTSPANPGASVVDKLLLVIEKLEAGIAERDAEIVRLNERFDELARVAAQGSKQLDAAKKALEQAMRDLQQRVAVEDDRAAAAIARYLQ